MQTVDAHGWKGTHRRAPRDMEGLSFCALSPINGSEETLQMKKRLGERVRLVLVLLWIIPSVLVFLGVSMAMLREPDFPFGIGLIETQGIQGLWAATPMGLLGATAVVLLSLRRRLGAKLLIFYCMVWVVSLLGGLLKDWYEARFTPQYCAAEELLAVALVTGAMVLCFVLVIFWAWHQTFGEPPDTGSDEVDNG
jgi:hypothetical protein